MALGRGMAAALQMCTSRTGAFAGRLPLTWPSLLGYVLVQQLALLKRADVQQQITRRASVLTSRPRHPVTRRGSSLFHLLLKHVLEDGRPLLSPPGNKWLVPWPAALATVPRFLSTDFSSPCR